ncbi:MAG: RecX family transcriptional regulator [Chloroflexota bacterium]
MPKITALQSQEHDSARVSVYLDGRFGFDASLLLVSARGLVAGMEISPEEVDALMHDAEVENAYEKALGFLSYRPRSTREIQDYFKKRKADPDVTLAVVEKLERSGLLNDGEFARYWVENRQTFQPRGSRALRAELRGKGVGNDAIDEALQTFTDEEETAYRAGLKKATSLASLGERDFFQKVVAFLQRRGFPYDAAAKATRRLAVAVREEALEDDYPLDQ